MSRTGVAAAAPGARVAERVAWFYAAHPRGRIITDLVTRAREVAVFRAAVYRDAGDALPAATGWSSGHPAGAALERVEEAAVGRALANLGIAAAAAAAAALGGDRPAADATPAGLPAGPAAGPPAAALDDPERRLLVADLATLVTRAERFGVRPRRAARWRARLRAGGDDAAVLREAERRLRAWVDRGRAGARPAAWPGACRPPA